MPCSGQDIRRTRPLLDGARCASPPCMQCMAAAHHMHDKIPSLCAKCTAAMHAMHGGSVGSCISCTNNAACAFLRALNTKGTLYGMDLEDIQRKIQFRQGSYVITIPQQVVHMLGIRRDQYVRFAVSNKMIIIKPVEAKITRRDIADAERDSSHLDSVDGDPRYIGDLDAALGRDPDPGTARSPD